MLTSSRFRIACFGTLRALLNRLGFELLRYNPKPSLSPQIGGPDDLHYLSLINVDLTQEEQNCVENFRTDRYHWINEYRWRLLLQNFLYNPKWRNELYREKILRRSPKQIQNIIKKFQMCFWVLIKMKES